MAKSQWKNLSIFYICDNNIGYDGLCSILHYDCEKLQEIMIIKGLKIWHIVYRMLMNVPKDIAIENCDWPNKQINKDITKIMMSSKLSKI